MAAAVTKTAGATATAAALNKAVGVPRCDCQAVSSWSSARTAVTGLGRAVKEERRGERAGCSRRAGLLRPGLSPSGGAGVVGRSVVRVAPATFLTGARRVRCLGLRSSEGAVSAVGSPSVGGLEAPG